MAPRKDYEVLEESAESGSNDTTSTAGTSTEHKEQNASSDFTTSCPAILEPSEDDPLFKREKIRRPLKTYRAIMRSFNSREIYENSDEPWNNGENGQQMGGRHSVCIDLLNRYKNFAVRFRNSKLVYVFQILLTLLPFSALWMGIKYSESCPGSPSLTVLTLLTGLFALILIGQWIVIKCCGPDDRPCEGQQKFLILFCFILVSGLLELEIFLFSKLSPGFDSSASNYCSKIFYDYTYYKFIAAFGSMFLVVLLYFPDYRSFASDITCSDPVTGGCYKGMMEEDE
ncbi:hypothetical protein AVEN_27624-1 [Araneus ventricosus]|uniref:Uncharacterized protein n=1 Tax=Araneus ventricosus TaxID=182803 RepID=A0A4Y2EMS6_ARAVE|nr:hypothetical protein AVEN_27624-1 [Araneus ventricosus]